MNNIPPPPPLAATPAPQKKSRRKFIVLGCLIAAVVIGIPFLFMAAGIIVPVIQRVSEKAQLHAGLAQAQGLSIICMEATENDPSRDALNRATTLAEAAAVLQPPKEGRSLWHLAHDPALKGKTATAAHPFSFALIVNIPKARRGHYDCPLLWTRGLQEDGTWGKTSPFGARGGIIGMSDGHVQWVTSIAQLGYTTPTGQPLTTRSQLLALAGPGAVLLEDPVE